MDNVPSLDIVLAAVRAVVRPIVKANELHTLTHKRIRTKVEEKLGLSQGTLEKPEYKGHVKLATLEAMDAPPSEGEEKPEKLSKKAKPAAKAVKKRKSAVISDASGDEVDEVEEKQKQKQKKSRVSEPPKPKKRKAKPPPPDSEPSEDEKDSEEHDEPPKASSSRTKLRASTSSNPTKKKKAVHVSFDEANDAMTGPEEEGDDGDFEGSDEEAKPKKRAVSAKGKGKEAARPRKPTTSKSSAKPSSSSFAPKQFQRKTILQFKTPEHVPTSDMEQDDAHEAKEVSPKKSPQKQAKAPVLRKHRKGSTMALSDSEDEDEGGRQLTPTPKHTPKKSSSTPKTVKEDSPAKKETKRVAEDDSESEMSSLIDEEPPKKSKSKSTSEPKKQSKSVAKRKSTTSAKVSGLTKEGETIKKLKSYVVGCGVRKKWATLFAGLSERQQISELKTILTGLGMTPPLSMEKAHKIKAKREFEQELEDVKEFAQSMNKRDGKKGTLKETSEEEEQSEEEAPVVRRKRLNARNSIAAFLGDQSDSD